MKCLTIREPWASLIVAGIKRIETRPRCTRYRGRIAIHAGLKRGIIDGGPERQAKVQPLLEGLTFHPGHVLGTVDLIDCIPAEDVLALAGPRFDARDRLLGDYSAGRWCWVLRDPQPLKKPVPASGRLSFWEWTP